MPHHSKGLQKHYQTILDSITDGVFTIDMNWKITSFNRAAQEITGVPKHKAIGKACFKVFKADVCGKGCILNETLKSGRPISNVPVYIVRADKRQIPISVNTALLRDSKGQVVGGIETFRDLTVFNRLRRQLLKQHSFEDIVSKNEKMLKIFSILPQISESSSTVLIEGASGSGKEIIAKAIHNHSPVKAGPFIAVNCGALPDTLIESELFGYKAGAFTDAKKDKPGRFALARNGTIFLDEIGDISPAVQVRLLRVLEQKTFEPLGATQTVASNARVIAATHRDLETRVMQGLFRKDLFFRVNVVRLKLPTLSERKEDIPLLADHFIDRFNHLIGRKILGMTQESLAAMMLYDWPGNVREFENAIEHAFVLCPGGLIRLEDLPERIHPRKTPAAMPTGLTLKEAEKRTILQALYRNNWKKMATARELGIDKNTLRRKILRLGIKPSEPG